MVYLRLTKIAGAVNWFRFLNCFLKTVSNNQFFNFYRNNFQYFRPQKRICFCAIVNWIYYRMFEGSLMAQIISAFFANSENLLHNSRRTTIRDSVHLNGENLQHVWRQNHLFQEVLQKSTVSRSLWILDNVRVACLFYFLMHSHDMSIQGVIR